MRFCYYYFKPLSVRRFARASSENECIAPSAKAPLKSPHPQSHLSPPVSYPACRGSCALRNYRNPAQGQTEPPVACRPHTCHPSLGAFSTKLSGSPHNLSLGSSHAKRKQVLNKYLLIDHLVDIFMSLTIII